jgi:murein DD-endopeptidase MepM/ murein hydrolase activator NlpD
VVLLGFALVTLVFGLDELLARQASVALDVRVRAREVAPGEVVRLDVTAPAELSSVTVSVPWHPVVPFRVGAQSWRALVGLDLDVVPGAQPVTITARTSDNQLLEHTEEITIQPKEFATRTLQVAPRFANPPKSAVPRINRERMLLSRLFRVATALPAWRDPFQVPIPGALVSGFGVRSVFNNEPRAPHGGADFASPEGTPVAAPNAGRVTFAGDLYFTGQTVVIDHGAGLHSLVAHLSRIDVREGDVVTRGQIVGAVGATGRATGPHLHWTVRLNGARVDPLSLVYATEDQ